jgi:hypothetical protein
MGLIGTELLCIQARSGLTDISGNGVSVSGTDVTVTQVAGKDVFNFNGTTSVISMGAINIGSAFSVSCWVRPSIIRNFNMLHSRSTSSSTDFVVYSSASGIAARKNRNNGGVDSFRVTNNIDNLKVNAWSCLIVVFDSDWEINHDNYRVPLSTPVGDNAPPLTTGEWKFGAVLDTIFGGTSSLIGLADDIRIFAGALTDDQKAQIFLEGPSPDAGDGAARINPFRQQVIG